MEFNTFEDNALSESYNKNIIITIYLITSKVHNGITVFHRWEYG